MRTLYIASTETYVGKSAVSMGILQRMHNDGLRVGYMKPLSVSAVRTTESGTDEDTELIRQTFNLSDPIKQMAPVAITPSVIETIMQGKQVSYTQQVQDAFAAISENRDVVVVEGANTWAEGALVNLTAMQVIELLNGAGLLVARYRSLHSVDIIVSVKRFIGDRLLGVLLNHIELPQLDYVRERVVPFLEQQGIPVLGLLPQDRLLASVTVRELYEHLGGELIGEREWCNRPVESLMIGAMTSGPGLMHFRRNPNKAVITGGDRIDLQLVALETSTSVLILTGDIGPSMRVIVRAEDVQVPIIVVPDDTLRAVERTEEVFGKVRFHEAPKLDRFTTLMNEHFNFARLYEALGMSPR
ncbi:MAG: phosphotransacetylase family protein [Chloroflexaceae bacterium]|nr:phosphotransacetylase family protein [Chloroflexaceae bacterium]NJO07052.1 phosphotransacetylase family protein [Chloroflexaceae bacterium]